MARNNMNDDWGFEESDFGGSGNGGRPSVQPRYGGGPRPNANRGSGQPQMRGVNQREEAYTQGDMEYPNGYNQQGGYNQQQQGGAGGQNPNEPKKDDKKKTSRLKKVVIGLIVTVVVFVLLWGAVKLVKVKDKNKATETNQTTQTTKKSKKATTEGTNEGTKQEDTKKNESIADIGGTKDSSAKEKLDTKSIESEVYSNTATVKTVELITTGKLTASYHFMFEMGSTHLDMYLNEFEAENLKVGDKVKISFKKIPSKDKVVITDIQRA